MRDLLRAGPLLQMGWVVAFSVLIPLGAGILLDRRFDTAPLFVLIGALVGIIASTVAAIRISSQAIDALARPPDDTAKSDPSADLDNPGTGKED